MIQQHFHGPNDVIQNGRRNPGKSRSTPRVNAGYRSGPIDKDTQGYKVTPSIIGWMQT